MKATIERRLDVLESALGPFCPQCTALGNLSEEEIDARLEAFRAGRYEDVELPDPSPTCPHCQKIAAMSEAELDAEFERMMEIIEDVT